MKKNILRTCALTAALILGLTACGGSEKAETKKADAESPVSTENEETAAGGESTASRRKSPSESV